MSEHGAAITWECGMVVHLVNVSVHGTFVHTR
jgi:hypothetical protein